ncbi:hypothetical protein ACFOGJ_28795 [Marinibaculum pumilum]|uniref:Uncharacterized protein n=1 Tax=Marinibaculum pumilum TaxID=1766165 RepID=A0ABV7L9B5_9PROT
MAVLALIGTMLADLPPVAAGGVPVERVTATLADSFGLAPSEPCDAASCLAGVHRGNPDIQMEVQVEADGTVRGAFLLFPLIMIPPLAQQRGAVAEGQIMALAASLRFVANASGERVSDGSDLSALDHDGAVLRYIRFRDRVAAFQAGEIAAPPLDTVAVPGGMLLTFRLLPPGNLAGIVLHRH